MLTLPVESFFTGLLLLSSALQVYYLASWAMAVKDSAKYLAQVGKSPPVSVIIAARNEAQRLGALVNAIAQQDYPNFEIIVVNDRSADGSELILEALAQKATTLKVLHIRDLPTGWNGKKYALTQGIAAANSGMILLTDADCVPKNQHWLGQMAAPLALGYEIVIGFGPYAAQKGLLNLCIRHETLYTGLQYLGMALNGKAYMGVGRNMAYTKQLFEEIGGFGGLEHLNGGDDDLLLQKALAAKKAKVAVVLEGQTVSVPHTRLSSWIRQKLRHLAAGKQYQTQHRLHLAAFQGAHLGWYLSLAVLILFGANFMFWAGLYIFRLAVLASTCAIFRSKLAFEKDLLLALPLTDFLFAIYLAVVGPASLVTQTVRWKN